MNVGYNTICEGNLTSNCISYFYTESNVFGNVEVFMIGIVALIFMIVLFKGVT